MDPIVSIFPAKFSLSLKIRDSQADSRIYRDFIIKKYFVSYYDELFLFYIYTCGVCSFD